MSLMKWLSFGQPKSKECRCEELLGMLENILDGLEEIYDARAHPDGTEGDTPYDICCSYWVAGNIDNYRVLRIKEVLGHDLTEAELGFLRHTEEHEYPYGAVGRDYVLWRRKRKEWEEERKLHRGG